MITQQHAIELFYYNPETGDLRLRKVTRGDGTGYIDDNGYRRFWINENCRPYGHQIAWLIIYGEWCPVDHKDRNGSNLKINNLRKANKSQNAANSKTNCRNALGIKGVSICKATNRFRVDIQVNGKGINLGRYDTIQEAMLKYEHAAVKYFGEFART